LVISSSASQPCGSVEVSADANEQLLWERTRLRVAGGAENPPSEKGEDKGDSNGSIAIGLASALGGRQDGNPEHALIGSFLDELLFRFISQDGYQASPRNSAGKWRCLFA